MFAGAKASAIFDMVPTRGNASPIQSDKASFNFRAPFQRRFRRRRGSLRPVKVPIGPEEQGRFILEVPPSQRNSAGRSARQILSPVFGEELKLI
jgi:hypothetical protein